MRLLPPISTRTYTLLPYTTLFRSFEIRYARRLEARRQADVAIVVANGAEAACVQRIDEFVGPERQLAAEAHDQQDGGRLFRPLVLKGDADAVNGRLFRSEEHTSELQSLMRYSYAVFCLKKKPIKKH